jgi:hypothetical protein
MISESDASRAGVLDAARNYGPVFVIEDRPRLAPIVGYICDFLDVPLERVGSRADLASRLADQQPIAVICELDGNHRDGCDVMKTVALHDPALPIMLVTGSDPALIGAAEAVEEIWALSSVLKLREAPGLGDVVDFLFRSGRLAGASGLMPV